MKTQPLKNSSIAGFILLMLSGLLCPNDATGEVILDLSYEPSTGNLSMGSSDFQAHHYLDVVSSGRLFQGEPAVPLGTFWSGKLFYVQSPDQTLTRFVDFGRVLPSGLTPDALVNDLCVSGASVQDDLRFLNVDRVNLNGLPVSYLGADCPIVPLNHDVPSTDAPHAIVHYDASTGGLRVDGVDTPDAGGVAAMAVLHIKSEAHRFTGAPAAGVGSNVFDMDSDERIFKLEPTGFTEIDYGPVLEPGLSPTDIIADLCVEGAWIPPASLQASYSHPDGGLVPLVNCSAYDERPAVDLEVTYDAQEGRLTVDSQAMTNLELTSETGIFHGGIVNDLGRFDRQSVSRIRKLDADGVDSFGLGRVVEKNLSIDFLSTDLEVNASFLNGARVGSVRISSVPEPTCSGVALLVFLLAASRLRLRRGARLVQTDHK